MDTYILKYELKKRYEGLYREIEKLIGFYYDNILSMELVDGMLNVTFTANEENQEQFKHDIGREIDKFVKGYKEFDTDIMVESKQKKEVCSEVNDLNYIEVANGVRCKVGQRAVIEDNLSNFIIQLFENNMPSCRFIAPSMIDYKTLIKLGYFTKFPNLVNFIKNFKKDPTLIRKISKGELNIESPEIVDSYTDLSKKVLNPVTCYQVYPLANKLIQSTGKSNFTVTGNVYRFESYNMSSTRLNEFKIIEQVHFGTKEEVIQIRNKEIELFTNLFNEWELDFKIETSSDVFYGDEAALLISAQKYENGKFEISMNSDKGYMSVGSFNLHNQYFTERFHIYKENELLTSGCCGFGIERLVYCIFSQHGEDIKHWPEKLKKDLFLI